MIEHLSSDEVEIVRQCLVAVAEGPFFSDDDAEILMGSSKREFCRVSRAWPRVNPSEASLVSIILLNIVMYPHGRGAAWSRYIAASPSEVDVLRKKLFDETSGSE